jgi:hypothetical protein
MFAAKRGWKALGLGATASLCLLLLQLAVATGAPARQGLGQGLGNFSSPYILCAQIDEDANKTPLERGHAHKNCLTCAFWQAASLFDNSALAAKSGAPSFREAPASASSGSVDAASLLAAGFASSWSSRAPPIFS